MARKASARKHDAPPAVETNGAVLSLTFDQRDQAHQALQEIDAALASLYVLFNYCEEHSLHRTPLLALHSATTAIKGPHARLEKLLDHDANANEEACHE